MLESRLGIVRAVNRPQRTAINCCPLPAGFLLPQSVFQLHDKGGVKHVTRRIVWRHKQRAGTVPQAYCSVAPRTLRNRTRCCIAGRTIRDACRSHWKPSRKLRDAPRGVLAGCVSVPPSASVVVGLTLQIERELIVATATLAPIYAVAPIWSVNLRTHDYPLLTTKPKVNSCQS